MSDLEKQPREARAPKKTMRRLLWLIPILALVCSASAQTRHTGTHCNGTAPLSCTFTSTAGGQIIAFLAWRNSTDNPTVSDGTNGSYTLVTMSSGSNPQRTAADSIILYCFPNSAGGSITITDAGVGAGVGRAMVVFEYTGTNNSCSSLDGTNSNSNTSGTALTAGNITTANAHDAVIGGFYDESASSCAQSGSWLIQESDPSVVCYVDQLVTSTGTYNPAVTMTGGTGAWQGIGVTVKAAASGAPANQYPRVISAIGPHYHRDSCPQTFWGS